MTFAELATAITIFGCGGIAGLVAASEKAGWFTMLFVLAGLSLGFGFGLVVHKLAYRLLRVGNKNSGAFGGWLLLFFSIFPPTAVAFSAIAITGWLTFMIVRQVL